MSLREVKRLFLEIDDDGNGTVTERGKDILYCYQFLIILWLYFKIKRKWKRNIYKKKKKKKKKK